MVQTYFKHDVISYTFAVRYQNEVQFGEHNMVFVKWNYTVKKQQTCQIDLPIYPEEDNLDCSVDEGKQSDGSYSFIS